jgi:hypothetical protein
MRLADGIGVFRTDLMSYPWTTDTKLKEKFSNNSWRDLAVTKQIATLFFQKLPVINLSKSTDF